MAGSHFTAADVRRAQPAVAPVHKRASDDRGSVRDNGSAARLIDARMGLTLRMREALTIIAAHGGPMSYRPLAARLGLKGHECAYRLAKALQERGYVRMTRRGVQSTALRFIPMEPKRPGQPTAYTGRYPIVTHPTCAEWLDHPETNRSAA